MARLTSMLVVAVLLAARANGAPSSSAATCAPGCTCVGSGMTCADLGLTALPQGTWPSVQLLDVSRNAISSLDGLGEHFPALTVLIASDNRLAQLPLDAVAGPGAPPQFTALFLTRNAIERVLPPSAGVQLNGLAFVYLGGNRIAELERDVFQQLPRLQHLSLNENPLVVPAGRPLLTHPRLNALDLRQVDARVLSSSTFAELPALEEVGLDGSGVRNISGVFSQLRALQIVYLQSNDITEISEDSFSKEVLLSQLSLANNPLKRIDTSVLPIKDKGELDIQGTPLACACGYKQVALWAAEHKIRLLASCSDTPACPF